MNTSELLSEQRRYLGRYQNLQHCRLRFAPGRDRSSLDLLNVIEAGGIAPVAFRDRDSVKTWDVEARNPRRLLQYGKRFEDAIFIVLSHRDQNRNASTPRPPQ